MQKANFENVTHVTLALTSGNTPSLEYTQILYKIYVPGSYYPFYAP